MKAAPCLVGPSATPATLLQGGQAPLDLCTLRRIFRQCRKCPHHPACGLVQEFNQAVQVALDRFADELRRPPVP